MTSPKRGRPPRSAHLDAAAIGASFACLVHCLLLPLVLALAPAASHLVQLPDYLHAAVFFFALPVSALAMLRGYRRHGLRLPAVVGALGLILIGAGAAGGLWTLTETGLTVAGSALLAIGHAINWKLKARSFERSETLTTSS